MVRGFYTLGSGMLTQSRKLNTISNNIANVNTSGFKKSTVMERAFGDMVIDRSDGAKTPIGDATLMNTADEAVTDFSQGDLKGTDRSLDFAIKGGGFFAVQGEGGTVYTRNGSFNVDGDGYLVLKGVGRVLGQDGGPILLGTDDVTSDGQGDLFAGGRPAGRLAVYDFADYAGLATSGNGVYTGGGAVPVAAPSIEWKSVELSNTDMTQEMTGAIASQRSLQTCSEALKMYDQVLDQAVSDISRL